MYVGINNSKYQFQILINNYFAAIIKFKLNRCINDRDKILSANNRENI